ncbi:MAG: lipopolysaccharide heptosyltransferase II [candidate division NC10 bacterium]|nr:lipopolysaccharide heptosyltransferase II [candidate division NC10 bacterium]
MGTLPIQLDGARRILLVKPSALGDVVHALPVAASLARRYPAVSLDWLVEEESADVVRGHPAVAETIVSRRLRWLRQLRNPSESLTAARQMAAFARRLRGARYDVVLDLQGLLKSAIYILCTGAPVRVGFAEGREGAPLVLTHRLMAPPQPVHAVERYLALAAAVGATEAVREFRIPVAPEDAAAAEGCLAGLPTPRVVLHPVARWRTKLWEVARWRELAGRFSRQGMGVILIGGPGDLPVAEAIAAGMAPGPRNLVGALGLKPLAALLARVDLMVCVDSGPMHVASAVGTPVVALFGPTDPRRTGPLGPAVVLRRELPCSPCLDRRCRIPDAYLCMREIAVEEVWKAAQSFLSGFCAGRAKTKMDSRQ